MPAEPTHHRIRDWLVVLLAVNSGATDAIGFLALGGAFTSVMTGNMVLLGTAAAGFHGTAAAHIGTAIVCYIGGCAIGAAIAGTPRADDPVWPMAITRALAVEAVLVLSYAVGWWVFRSRPDSGAQLALLSVSAVALGIQSSAVQRFGVSGLSTTYLTGTLTTIVIRVVSGRPVREVVHSAQILLGLVGGAAAGAAFATHFRSLTPIVQVASLASVLLLASLRFGVSSRVQRAPAQRAVDALARPRVVVVGAGRLGQALLSRIASVDPDDPGAAAGSREVVALTRGPSQSGHRLPTGVRLTHDASVVEGSDVVLLAVPPDATAEVVTRLSPHLDANTIVANMATEAATGQLQALAPTARVVSAKVIGQASELASGARGVIVIDGCSETELMRLTAVLGGLGEVVTGEEGLVLRANQTVAREVVRAERTMRHSLAGLALPAHAIDAALTTMAVGVLRAVATRTYGPFLRRFVEEYDQSDNATTPPAGAAARGATT